MSVLGWLFGKSDSQDSNPSPSSRAWPADPSTPSGLVQNEDSLREQLLELASLPEIRRLVLLRANGGLFCGREHQDKEVFSRSVQRLSLAGRKAARRLGLGAMEFLRLDTPEGGLGLVTGHSLCAVQFEGSDHSHPTWKRIENLAGLNVSESSVARGKDAS